MHYYKFNIGDYRRQTHHLTLLEHGIYRSLLDSYYLNEVPLCSDKAKLMRSHSVRTENEIEAFNNVLSDFFYLTDEGYRHSVCDKIIDKYHEKSEKARKSAQARWEKDANASKTQCESNANHKPLTNNHNKTLPKGNEPSPTSGNRANGIPYKKFEQWYTAHCPAQTKIISTSWTPSRKSLVKSAWLKNPDEEWWESFFEYCGEIKFFNGENSRGWKADMFWILKPENFAKTTERKYK